MAALTALAMMATAVFAQENQLGVKYGINPNSMISYDNIYLGWAPNYDPQITFTGGSGTYNINQATGQKGATYNVYAQINGASGGTYTDQNGQFPTQDIIDSGAVLIASLMPSVGWSDITPELCQSVASFFQENFVQHGTHVWLRYAHEVNYYVTDGTYPGGNDPDAYKTSWNNMYDAVHAVSGIDMYWSPNFSGASKNSELDVWWPGTSKVDIVGIDAYPRVGASSGVPSFDSVYGDFYSTYSEPNGLPFAIGETSAVSGNGGTTSIQNREAWLKEIINNGNYGNYPNYISATWFEYGSPTKDTDFYVVYGQSGGIVDQTVSNTKEGSS